MQDLVLAGLVVNSTTSENKRGASWKNANFSRNMGNPSGTGRISNVGNYYDRFRNRLIIPIRRVNGQVIAFGGRTLDGLSITSSDVGSSKPKASKYINSPETLAFIKSRTVFGLDLAKKSIIESGIAILVEGYFDAISLHNSGVPNAVAIMGTAVSIDQLMSVSECATKKRKEGIQIVILFDTDVAGQDAIRRTCTQVLPGLPATMDVRIGSLNSWKNLPPTVKDASDLCVSVESSNCENESVESVVGDIISAAVGWKEWMIDDVMTTQIGGIDPDSLAGKRVALSKAIKFIKSLPEVGAFRSLLVRYCVDRIAGENVEWKMQLQQEVLQLLDENVDSRRNYGTTFSSPVYPKLPERSITNYPSRALSNTLNNHVGTSYCDNIALDGDVDVDEMFSVGMDLTYTQRKQKRKRNVDEDMSLFREESMWQSENEIVPMNTTSGMETVFSHITARNLVESETCLLTLYIRFPELRKVVILSKYGVFELKILKHNIHISL